MRVTIRVKPGASSDRVGGSYASGQLVVAVTARAVGGQATEAALRQLAHALGLKRADVTVVSGHNNRTKVVEVNGDPDAIAQRMAGLLDATSDGL